ncbi:hypothetical protein H4582DRAFT_2127845 [Lactarius indigo]|nr:hypothetical protein H4582DRAFT_2127845 [Lactarius indigo]
MRPSGAGTFLDPAVGCPAPDSEGRMSVDVWKVPLCEHGGLWTKVLWLCKWKSGVIFPGACQCCCPGCAGGTETVQDPSENTFTASEELSQLGWTPNSPSGAKRHYERRKTLNWGDRNGTPEGRTPTTVPGNVISTARCSNRTKPKHVGSFLYLTGLTAPPARLLDERKPSKFW